MSALIGKKLGMTRVFTDAGQSIPVTVIEAGPCYITDIRTVDKNGYEAVQLGFGEAKEQRLNKPRLGHFAKLDLKPLKYLKEFRGIDVAERQPGEELKADVFAEGDFVKVTGRSKGKGFQGVVKRHGFGGGVATHGMGDTHRAPGSIGQSSYPSRVLKGIRMAGRMGNDKVTLGGLEVIKVDVENNLLLIKGAVPGAKNGIVYISK
jgi:large subunit ribosomal protein L3